MSQLGQTEKNSVRAYVFRFALELCSIQIEEEARSRTKTPSHRGFRP
jgi:hypothetical protein